MSEKKTAYCSTCSKQVSYHCEKVSHVRQLLLTLISCGMWLPIWLTVTFKPTKLCDECRQPIWDD